MTADIAFREFGRSLTSAGTGPEGIARLITKQARLPRLDETIINQLGRMVEQTAHSDPLLGWTITALAEKSSRDLQREDWEARAAFYKAWAANVLSHPQLVVKAAEHARVLFSRLDQPGWAAAATWQRYDQPWIHPDFLSAAENLEGALRVLSRDGPAEYIPHVQRALAAARTLPGDFTAAEAALDAAETAFRDRNDPLNLARCWFNRSGLLRRRGDYPRALDLLSEARDIFVSNAARLDLAKIDYQLAAIHLYWKTDLEFAGSRFESARAVFAQFKIPLWEALCDNGLAQVEIKSGNLAPALGYLGAARSAFSSHGVSGSLADNLVDTAQLEMASGDARTPIEKNKAAEQLYLEVGVPVMASVARMYQGENWAQLGRYQAALKHLEVAHKDLLHGRRPDRLAECEALLGQVWLMLNDPGHARPFLERSLAWFSETGNASYLALTHAYLARAALLQNDDAQAVESLGRGLDAARKADLKPLIAFVHRLLGEAHLSAGRPAEAAAELEKAADSFMHLQMPVEEAFCRARLGACLSVLSQEERAEAEWRRALDLSDGVFPEISWQAYAGLAGLSGRRAQPEKAVGLWQHMVRALSLLRAGFTQPALFGAYFNEQQAALDQAVAFAAASALGQECLSFIEESKALILARQIAGESALARVQSAELDSLRTEITWQKNRLEQLRISGATFIRMAQDQRILTDLMKSYDRLFLHLEREQDHPGDARLENRFSLAEFTRRADESLGAGWMALDYYQLDDAIVLSVLSPAGIETRTLPLLPETRFLLDQCRKAHLSSYSLSPSDLKGLGTALIPADLAVRTGPDSCLLISPHKDLHVVPWSALRVANGQGGDRCLVEGCVPISVPSLHAWSVLVHRPGHHPDRGGLLVAAGSFQGRHPDLPQAAVEARELQARMGQGIEVLEGAGAAWEHVLEKAGEAGLSGYRFLHLATHAFHNPRTARMSGFALYDRDVWLEDLWDLAPLPPLITFSACSSARSLVYAGDEPDGLAVTCLAAGARTVIGSLWPVLDEVSARRMSDLYAEPRAGERPAAALAGALRAAIRRGEPVEHWGGFLCMGCGV